MIRTVAGAPVSGELVGNFFHALVNSFFKILPMREDEEVTLPVYIRSLQVELLGCKELISELNNDARFLRLLATLQYLIDHPRCSVQSVKREVFKSIRLCEQMSEQYRGA